MVVLHVGFFKYKCLHTSGRVGHPLAIAPAVQLVGECELLGSCGKGVVQVARGVASQEKLLEGHIFCGASVAGGVYVAATLAAVPVCGGNRVEVGAAEMVGPVAAIANNALLVCGSKRLLTTCAWRRF